MRTGDTKEDVGEILDDPQMRGAYVSEIYEYLREMEPAIGCTFRDFWLVMLSSQSRPWHDHESSDDDEILLMKILRQDLSKKRKHQPSSVPSEESCTGENRIPVPAILHRNRVCTLLDSGSAMLSSQNRPWQYDQEKMANWRFPLNPMTMRVCFLLGNSDGFSGSHKPSALIDLSLAANNFRVRHNIRHALRKMTAFQKFNASLVQFGNPQQHWKGRLRSQLKTSLLLLVHHLTRRTHNG